MKSKDPQSQKAATATLEDAIALAVQTHRGQQDKTGEPYILHPLRLMFQMDTELEKIVAVLHDVVEDSAGTVTIETLAQAGFPESAITAIDALSRRDIETYEEFIERLKSNDLARKVKLADLQDNMNPLRLQSLQEKDLRRLQKYHKAWRNLTSTSQE